MTKITNNQQASNSKSTAQTATPEQQADPTFSQQQTFSGLLGEIVWLMQNSPLHRQVLIAELEWMVIQPMMLNQYRIHRKEKKPVGVVFWAKVDDEVHERLKQGAFKLRPNEWQSGENYWIIDVLAPLGNNDYFIKEAGDTIFAGKTYHYCQPKNNQLDIMTVEQA